MTRVAKTSDATARARWRPGGALTVLAIAAVLGAGQPASAATGGQAGASRVTQGRHTGKTTPDAAAPSGAKTTKAKPASGKPGVRAGAVHPNTPDPITGITVAAGKTTVDVSWTAYVSVNLDHYTVQAFNLSSVAGDSCNGNVAAIATTCTLAGLTQGSTYTITVSAYDSGTPAELLATGDSSSFEVGAPGAPTDVTASANSDGTISVDWSAPTDPGAGIVTYTASTVVGGKTCTTADAVALTCDILDPVPGTTYTVQVKANGSTNITDTSNPSDWSTASADVTALMGVPTDVTAAPTLLGIRVTWLMPTNVTSIVHYTATTSPPGGTCTGLAPTLRRGIRGGDIPSEHCTITSGLIPGVAYIVSVTATDGSTIFSDASDPSLPAVIGPLNVPTDVMAIAGNGTATVSWTAPTLFPVGSISYYTATSSPGNHVCHTPDAGVTTCLVYGLSNLTAYTFTVVAHSAHPTTVADSAASSASSTVIPLPTAINIAAVVNSKYVTAEHAGGSSLIANRTAALLWEAFEVTRNSDGTISLTAMVNDKYVTAERAGALPLIANRTAIGTWEKFTLIHNIDDTFSLQAMANGRYVTAELAGAQSLIANRTAIGTWEKFTITDLSP